MLAKIELISLTSNKIILKIRYIGRGIEDIIKTNTARYKERKEKKDQETTTL